MALSLPSSSLNCSEFPHSTVWQKPICLLKKSTQASSREQKQGAKGGSERHDRAPEIPHTDLLAYQLNDFH